MSVERHSYSTPEAFERLMLLIATLLKYPGLGCPEPEQDTSNNAISVVIERLQAVAGKAGISLLYYSEHTLRKDLKTLRQFGILDQPSYRWGYYLGTAALDRAELQLALNALHSQAKYQQDPKINHLYQTLERRLRGLQLADALFYPIRTHIDRSIVYTNPEEMMSQHRYRGTLYEKLEILELAITKGQAIELFRSRNPYEIGNTHYVQIYPLQLVYSDIAWYLLHEDCQTQHLALSRIDRFSDHLRVIDLEGRSMEKQRRSLEQAHRLLEVGWGRNLGSVEEQKLERQGLLPFVKVIVRFFPAVMMFILEGEKRHPNQEIQAGPKGKDGKSIYVDYSVELPNRSLNEFCFWVCRFMEHAQFLLPDELIKRHETMSYTLLQRYEHNSFQNQEVDA